MITCNLRGKLGLPGASLLSLAGLISAMAAGGAPEDTNWPSFRGPRALGIANGYSTPTTWNVEEKKGVQWKTPIPGLGHSSPVIWGDRIFVTSALSGKEKDELKIGLYGDIASVNDDTEHQW